MALNTIGIEAARRRNGFTLIELLVVIAIIGILVALLFPAVQAVRESARRVHCQNNLRQIGLGLQNHLASKRSFPPAAAFKPAASSWVPHVLPFVEQVNLYHAYHIQLDWFHPDNYDAIATPISLLNCPSTPVESNRMDDSYGFDLAITDYAPIVYVADSVYDAGYAPKPPDSRGSMCVDEWVRSAEVVDGLSHTMMITEDVGRPVFYTRAGIGPENNDPGGGNFAVVDGHVYGAGWADSASPIPLHGFTADGLSVPGPIAINATNNNEAFSFHPAGVNALFTDGSVHFLAELIDIRVYAELVTRAGGETTAVGFLD